MATNVTSLVPTEPKIVNRWVQMCACIVAMMAIANLQYAWTLFTKLLTSNLHATLAAVSQVTTVPSVHQSVDSFQEWSRWEMGRLFRHSNRFR